MSRILNSTKLVESVRKRAMIPTDTSVYTDQDILDIINEEMDIGLLPTLLSLNEEHLVNYIEYNTDSNTARFKIPYRAIANKLRDVAYVDSTNGIYEMSRISLEELSDYRSSRTTYNENVFYVEGDEIVLVDNNLGTYEKIRMYYYLRPNTIVKQNEVGTITAIDRTAGVITLSNFPDSFNSIPEMDFINSKTPNNTYSYDVVPTSINSTTKTVTFSPENIPVDLSVGDFLCVKEQSPVPQIPTEMHPVLAQMAAVHILEALGDSEGLRNALTRLEQMKTATMSIVDDRVEGAPQKIKPRNGTLVNAVGNSFKYKGRF